MNASDTKSEFSRPIEIETLQGGPFHFNYEASAAECAAVAKRFGIEALGALSIKGVLTRIDEREIALDCEISALMRRQCVVTLDLFDSEFRESFRILFRRGYRDHELEGREAAENQDWIEPLEEGALDIGEIALQFFALAIDPYPKKPGAAFKSAGRADAAERETPFAVLERLKPRE